MNTKETFERIEKTFVQVSDTYIRHYESEIKYTQEKAKLSLWIISLSVGLELFILNKMNKGDLVSIVNKCLFISVSIIFLINAFLGLLTRLKQTRMVNHFLQIITLYDYQKTKILLNLNDVSDIGKALIKDFSEGKAMDKINNLEYINEKETKNDQIIALDTAFLLKSDNTPTTLFILQAILTIIYFAIITFSH
jgi:hypothetical protein